MNQEVLLSIVTVTYNAEKAVEETIQTVLSQKDWHGTAEYIFVDGKSSDDTVNVIRKYIPAIVDKGMPVQVISEPDRGIYDAMNKAMALAKGRWILFLNAGDLLYDEWTLQKLESSMRNSDSEVLYGGYCRVNPYIEENIMPPEPETLKKGMQFCHQSVLVRDSIYRNQAFDLQYRYCADYAMLLDAYLHGKLFEKISVCFVRYNIEGASAQNMAQTYREQHMVRRNLGVVQNSPAEVCRFQVGMMKRRILAVLPEKLRWKLYGLKKAF